MSSFFFLFSIVFFFLAGGAEGDTDTFVFGGCSQIKYNPGTTYEQALNSILTSLVNNAMFNTYNNFTTPATTSSSSRNFVSGVFQCRGDLASQACGQCVARAVSRLATLCPESCGAAIQLEGCFVKYDNQSFIGVSDKTLVVKKCGPAGSSAGPQGSLGVVLDSLNGNGNGNGLFRVGGSGDLQGVAQCVGDLSGDECQDCVSEAVGKLRSECGSASWGDVYLAKCFARFSYGGFGSDSSSRGGRGYYGPRKDENNNNDDEIEKTLAILIGLIAGVGLLIVFLSFLRKLCCESGEKGGK